MVTRQQIASLLSDYSVEVTPASAARVADFAAHVPAGTTVNVTFLPGSDFADTISVCARLRREGFNPVPHIAARSFESRAHLESGFDQLASQAAVTEALVIGSGAARQAGPFADTMQILASGLLERYGITRIGVAGHPEGSPDIPSHAVSRALAEKNAWARDSDADVYIVTQFCFDVATVLNWERQIRRDGNRLPIHTGVPGPATVKTLLKFARMSGVGPSMRMLVRQGRNIARLLVVQEPDAMVSGLAKAVADDPERLIRKIHFYPFGGLGKTADWVNAVVADQIDFGYGDGVAARETGQLRIAS